VTRPAGQVSARAFLLGLALVALAVAGVVRLSSYLLDPARVEVQLPAPAEDERVTLVAGDACPSALDVERSVLVTSAALVECPDVFDGEVVRYEGEVIAGVLRRGDHAWVQLNDDPYALGAGPLSRHRTTLGGNSGMSVALSPGVGAAVSAVGDHDTQGDVIAVEGVFLRNDPRDGGAPSIRAREAAIVRRGGPVAHDVSPRRAVAAALLAAVTLVVAGLTIRARRA
jgi:hypothetical protein